MKKNNISLILSALIFLSPQINLCSQSQGWYSYVPSASSALQSFRDYGSAFVQGVTGHAGRAFGSMAGSIKSLSKEAQVALFFAVAGALAVAGYKIYYSSPGEKEIKRVTPKTPKDEKEGEAKRTLLGQQPAQFADIGQPQPTDRFAEKISESSSKKEQIEIPAQERQAELEQKNPEFFKPPKEKSFAHEFAQITKESDKELISTQSPHVAPSSTITTTTTVAPTTVTKQQTITREIKLRNGTMVKMVKLNI